MSGIRTRDPFDILLRSNHWAISEILARCSHLTTDRLHQRFEIGPGSLHDTLTHIISTMRRWADRIAERPLRPSLERAPAWFPDPTDAKDRTVPELQALLDDATLELGKVIAHARQDGLDRHVNLTLLSPDGPVPYTLTVGGMVLHVLTHGRYHVAQCVNMLRHLHIAGISDKLPDLDLSEWQSFVDGRETSTPSVTIT